MGACQMSIKHNHNLMLRLIGESAPSEMNRDDRLADILDDISNVARLQWRNAINQPEARVFQHRCASGIEDDSAIEILITFKDVGEMQDLSLENVGATVHGFVLRRLLDVHCLSQFQPSQLGIRFRTYEGREVYVNSSTTLVAA